MIVLDEHFVGRGTQAAIRRFYPGKVVSIEDLRPETVIPDEAVPALLSRQKLPTFVTINARDFWRIVPADTRYCVVCAAVTDRQIDQVPLLLRRLLRHPRFRTRRARMGLVIRLLVNGAGQSYGLHTGVTQIERLR